MSDYTVEGGRPELPMTEATVNTGKEIVTVKVGQLWRSRDPRDDGRQVLIYAVDRLRVYVQNWKTKRRSRGYLQDFVRRFEFVKDYVVDPERSAPVGKGERR